MKSVILIPFLFLLSIKTFSQSPDSLKQKYNNQTITRYGSGFLKGSEKLSYKDLPNELKRSELGMISFNLANKHKTTATVYRLLSIGSLIASISFIRSNRDLALGLMGGNVVFTIFGSRHITQYQQHLDRALWQYNKDVLFPGGR